MSLLEREGEHRAPRAFVESFDERSFDSRAEGFYSDGQPFGGHMWSASMLASVRESSASSCSTTGELHARSLIAPQAREQVELVGEPQDLLYLADPFGRLAGTDLLQHAS